MLKFHFEIEKNQQKANFKCVKIFIESDGRFYWQFELSYAAWIWLYASTMANISGTCHILSSLEIGITLISHLKLMVLHQNHDLNSCQNEHFYSPIAFGMN